MDKDTTKIELDSHAWWTCMSRFDECMNLLQDARLLTQEREYWSLQLIVIELLNQLDVIGKLTGLNGQERIEDKSGDTGGIPVSQVIAEEQKRNDARADERKKFKEKNKELDYLPKFRVVSMGDGKFSATRFGPRAKEGRPLLRKDIYEGRMNIAECEYAHTFMCGGFPHGDDPDRPSKEEWLNEEPYEFEVDTFVTEKLFGEKGYLG